MHIDVIINLLIGIGDSALLSKLGIQTVVDLPGVGENLRESAISLCASTGRLILDYLQRYVPTFVLLRKGSSYSYQDHFTFPVDFEIRSEYQSVESLRDPKVAEEHTKLL